jgi:hypothetical protein
MLKRVLGNFALVFVSVGLAAVGCELLFRAVLFSDLSIGAPLRDPGLYFRHTSSDYWKLYYRLGGREKPPETPHPLLGWGRTFSRETYLHHEADQLGGRRPVLLYGDSFAQCVQPVREASCFQHVLNRDERFSAQHLLLNYGVGNYGVDQIYLLLTRSVRLYRKPFVVVSILLEDLDRSLLPVRIGQKPYFAVTEGGHLALGGVPIDPVPARYFREHPPAVGSYLFRLWYNSHLRPVRARRFLERWLGSEAERQERVRRVNFAILRAVRHDLELAEVEHIFLVFHHQQAVWRDDWRDRIVREALAGSRGAVVSSKEIIAADMRRTGRPIKDYYLVSDDHPSAYQVEVIAGVLRDAVLRAAPRGTGTSDPAAALTPARDPA